jgi:putative ABC transport system permease protein
MKAIGATDRDVLTVFLIEAGLVGLCGGIAGVGVAALVQNLVNQALANLPQGENTGGGVGMFLPIDPAQIGGNLFVIPPELALFALCLATAVGIGAGLYPSLRAAKLPPVIALKTE